jgi:cell division protein FtsL
MAGKTTDISSSIVVKPALAVMQYALLACLLLILGSAIGVVYLAQQSRLLFTELEASRKAQYQLDTRWNRLLLERSTLLSSANVERVARAKLGMGLPPPEDIVVVQP